MNDLPSSSLCPQCLCGSSCFPRQVVKDLKGLRGGRVARVVTPEFFRYAPGLSVGLIKVEKPGEARHLFFRGQTLALFDLVQVGQVHLRRLGNFAQRQLPILPKLTQPFPQPEPDGCRSRVADFRHFLSKYAGGARRARAFYSQSLRVRPAR